MASIVYRPSTFLKASVDTRQGGINEESVLHELSGERQRRDSGRRSPECTFQDRPGPGLCPRRGG